MQDRDHAETRKAMPVAQVERAGWRDLRAVAAIQKASFRPGLAYGLSALATLRVFPGVIFLVARTDAVPVAGCIIGDRHRGNLRVMNIAVSPEARRQGVATALLRGIEAAEPETDVVLMVEDWNAGAQDLYMREGYVRDGTSRDYYGTGRHGLRMTKRRSSSGAKGPSRIRI